MQLKLNRYYNYSLLGTDVLNSAIVADLFQGPRSIKLTLNFVSFNFYKHFELLIKKFNEKIHFPANKTALS